MKRIEVYYKKSFVIFFSVIFSVLFIFCVCRIVQTIGAFLKSESVRNYGGLPILILFCFVVPNVVIRLFEAQVTAYENGIVYMCRRGKITVKWGDIKRIYLTENDVLQIEVINRCTDINDDTAHIPLGILETDPLKLTEEIKNMLEEYKNAE